ncbi:MAG: SO_0444 family Cu/Zn efflux transporter [Halobacteriovoraceae bacterium]|nr:SO_0444 family Cu/Zn efflux transporter [Halobacteriovoraceae bacterium]MCB9095817.1 SO_0444 family Cu/Zn efflux transporter [Halobacteriovoraceae bacterium]
MMNFLDSLWQYILVSSPYLLLGFGVSGILHQVLSHDVFKKFISKNKLSDVFMASLFGVPLPLCSCSVIPTAVTLRKSGVSNGATSSFLIATPESGIDSIAMTYSVLDLPMTIIRPVAAFFSAFVAGTLNFFFNHYQLPEEEKEAKKSCCHAGKKEPEKFNLLTALKYGYMELMDDIAGWLSLGLLLGALISVIFPEDFFTSFGANTNRLIILAVGIPLYICASASTPIAASLMMKGLSPGAALILLLVGPATNASNIAVLQKYIGMKGVVINIASIIVISLGLSFAVDYFYNHYWSLSFNLEHFHEHAQNSAWQIGLAVIFIALLVSSLWRSQIKGRILK